MTKTYKVWKKCKNVPCGKTMDNCEPHYCSGNKQGSKNWSNCNMEYISPTKYKKRFTRKCRQEKNSRPLKKQLCKTSKVPLSVKASILHSKMPYIWRFLSNKTRKQMIKLALKPMSKLNV